MTIAAEIAFVVVLLGVVIYFMKKQRDKAGTGGGDRASNDNSIHKIK